MECCLAFTCRCTGGVGVIGQSTRFHALIGRSSLKLCSARQFFFANSTVRLTKRCSQPLAGFNHGFKFKKRSQFFIGADYETLSVVAMRVSNEDCSPARIDG